MGYVMVPIPEELVFSVMQFTLQEQARASLVEWDQPSMDELFAEVDETAKSLLAFVARVAVDGQTLAEAEAAQALQSTWREVFGVFRDLNERVAAEKRPGLLGLRTDTEPAPGGGTTEVRSYSMRPEVAELVVEAERRDLASGP
jgi:hypothetical protein